MKNKKDLLGGLIIIVLLLLVLITYLAFYNYKKLNNTKSTYNINIIKKDNTLSYNKTDLKDTLNKDNIIATYNCKYDDCDIYTNEIYDSLNDEYLIIKENNKVFIYNYKTKTSSKMYDDIIYKLKDFYIVLSNKKYGLTDQQGNIILDTIYTDIDYLNIENNQIKITKNNLKGLFNLTNKKLLKTDYSNIKLDYNNYYSALKDDLWYVINDNKEITKGYSYTFAFDKGFIAKVENNLIFLNYNEELLNETTISLKDDDNYNIYTNNNIIYITINNTIKYKYLIEENKFI